MTTEVENGAAVLTPEQTAEANVFKEQANEFFKSELQRKSIIT